MIEKNDINKNSLPRYLANEALELLEWPLFKKQLSSFATTPMGKKSIIDFEIPWELEDTQHLLDQTVEIYSLENEYDQNINFEGVFDIKKNTETCFKGGVISSIELLEIADTIAAARNLKKTIINFELRPNLSSLLENLVDHIELEKILKNGIDNNGRISDRASPKLSELRKQLISIKNERRLILDQIIRKNGNYIQDAIISERVGRPVLAIKVNYINKFKGIIHDSSSSGNTIFIEPEAVVSKGNKIASCKAKIANEEFKLLRSWANLISGNKDSLFLLSDILLSIENAHTRARYSRWIKGRPPKFESDLHIKITGFTHPLLLWENKNNHSHKITPIDFYIKKNTKVVSITGPNTGGKTAALKGIGMALLMAKSGLFLPSNDQPVIPFFANIYADIGDDQSLQENLSTFSGHILRIKKIFEALSMKEGLSIVLLDEIGSGTDPEEGTALAISLLEEFASQSDLTVATTHYGEIKALKYKDSRFENVSVSFDEESLKPTYTLNWGIPGRSNALTIARKYGINQKIIDQASNYLIPKETDNINKIIKGLEEQRTKQQRASEEAAALIARTEILYEELNNNYKYQKAHAKEIQAREKIKLTKTIRKAKVEVVSLIEKLRNKNATGEDSRRIGNRLKEIEQQFIRDDGQEIESLSWLPKIGDFVKIKSLNNRGRIISTDEKAQTFTVNCGSFNSVLSISELQGINGEQPNITQSRFQINSSKDDYTFAKVRTTKNTIDVRGLRVHEAEILVEEKIRKFHGPLWIIHGIGTGKLKKGLRDWLSDLDYIDKLEDAAPSEGGSGCTIAWIK